MHELLDAVCCSAMKMGWTGAIVEGKSRISGNRTMQVYRLFAVCFARTHTHTYVFIVNCHSYYK
jgi:hypothetical protein